ncbi:PAS domain S-box protein [Dechloromonas sp. A34]|uniref:PAS domain S-box protein n=1 Tax=Dechloromonas sp. A34 TaxID=447588 RepID=UPI002249412A|nr:EAL domain-containing protein [Dechloromonas sp. A34]
MTAHRIIDLIPCQSGHLHPDASLAEAATLMIEKRISSVIVVDGDRAVGIVTEGDMLHAMREHRAVDVSIAAVMTAPVHSVKGSVDFRLAYREAARLGIRHIVVTDESGLPVGVASESDFRHHLGPDFFRHLHDVDSQMDRLFPRLPPDASLDSALSAMEAVRATCAVIVADRKPLGILTERDVVRLFLNAADNPPLSSVMTQPAITIGEECSLAEAAATMTACGIRHLVVVDRSGHAVGLLSEHTLMRPLEIDLVDDMLAERQALTQSRDAALRHTKRSELYQRALLDNFPFLVWLKDTESRYLEVNRSFSNAVGGKSAADLIGKTDTDFFPPDLAGHYRSDDALVMASRQDKVIVEPILINRQPVWHETYKAPVIGEDGQLLGTVGFAQDISAKKRSEEGMLLRNAALSGLIRGDGLVGVFELIALSVEAEMPDWMCAILLAEEDGKYLNCTAAPRLPEEFVAAANGVPIAEGVGSCGTAAALRERVVVEDVFQHPHWSAFHDLARNCGFAACWAEPILGPAGELLGIFAAYHQTPARPRDDDLAQMNQASQLAGLVIAHQRSATRLERSLETFRGIFDSVSEALFIQSEDGSFLDVNRGAEQITGHPRSALIGRHYADFGAPGLNDQARADQQQAAAFAGTPQIFEYWAEDAVGRVLPIEVRLHPGDYFGRRVVIASIFDITERRNAALQLEVEHDLAQALASGLPREAVFGVILRAAMRFHEFDAGSVHALHPDGGYRLVTQSGLSPEFVAGSGDYAADSARAALVRAGQVVCSCSSAHSECSSCLLDENPALLDEGLRCLAVLPLVVAGQSVAFLQLGGHRTTQVSSTTMQALATLARHFAQTLVRLGEQEEAQRQQQNLSGLFDAVDDFIFIVDPSGHIVHHNQAVAEVLGYGPSALLGVPVVNIHPEDTRATARQLVAEILAGGRSTCSLPIQRANGEIVMVETRAVSGSWNGQPAFFGIAQDISERLIAEERQKLAASVFDNAHEGIMITDPRGWIIEVNATFTELTGYTRDEAVGQSADLLKSGHHEPGVYDAMWRTIRDVGYWRGEVWNRKKSGEIFVELLTISTVRNRNGQISQFVGIFSDITLLKEHQQRLEHLAHFDALTQLPNRMLLGDRMQTAMAQTERSGKVLAVCYLDLDGFKPVNDLYGHAIGDRLLVEVAQRLKTCVRAGDTVSRLGGDEFVLLFSGLDSVHECDNAIGRVISKLTHPFQIDGHLISISASIGVTLFPNDGADSDTLLRHADQAMYAAKQAGRNRFHLFDPEGDRRARVRREELSRLREGLARGEFALYYQPKVNMREGSVIGAEALIRWQHPELGLLPPGQFLPAIEGSELAIELGDWVIREALQQMAQWLAEGLDMAVSVNIAGNHLQSPGFALRLGELLAGFPQVSPARLELEILETAALEDIALAAEIFAECRQLGVSFALDDFGTGYSSLTYFRRLPADILKIDQSFVRDMLDDPDDLAIVEGVIGLTQAFKRKVIAEGVESVEHGLVLLLLGCDVAQGFGIAHPMPAAALPAWVGQFRPDELWGSATAFRWSREDLPMLIAEVEHTRWKKKLYAYLEDSTLSPPAGDHRSCRFGRWYYSPESRHYAGVEGYIALENTHARLHQIGDELIAAHLQRETARVNQLRLALEEVSGELIGHLQQIQVETLIAGQKSKR